MQSKISRRDFLTFMGQGSLALGISSTIPWMLSSCAILPHETKTGFRPLKPSSEDLFRVCDGLRYQRLLTWGDELSTGVHFGYNNDFIGYFPLEGKEGLLCVNHETPHSLFVGQWLDESKPKTKKQIEKEMEATGVSISHIRELETGKWEVIRGSKYNRMISGKTPIKISSPRAIEGSFEALGTLGNCAGGITPWGNYLTCEENYNAFYGEHKYRKNKKPIHVTTEGFDWYKEFPQPPEHYGWVTEIDPRTGEAKKLTALGRFAHEGATVKVAANGIPVVYMGDDSEDQCLYKFISDSKTSLEKGTLYVANAAEGKWIPMQLNHPKLKGIFQDQTELNIRAREAAKILGGTPLNRPEDIEICPRTGAVYLALTNNKAKGDLFGSILKLEEKGNDPLATEFQSSKFLAGGEKLGFACPDNMAFDPKGNLWITTDISGSSMNKKEYAPFKNNGLFYVPMEGEQAGEIYLVATAPTDAELTGPRFSPDGRTLFLSVQHPGELSKSLDQCTSHWPEGGNSIPKPALVAISGKLLDTIMGA
jgi:secreted PhoX family phosphatase